MPRTREAQDRHNQLRRQTREKGRQAMFSIDYIQTVYPEIYNEAVGFYTVLNSRYPDKPDLRKTNEYISFKKISKGEGSKSGEEFYFDIKTAMVMIRQTESPQAPETSCCQTPETSRCQAPEISRCESPEAPETSRCESPEAPETSRCESPQPPETSRCQSPQTSPQAPQTTSKEIEPQLEITLMSEDQVRKATVTTETLDIITEQEMPPVSFDDIPHDMIEEIISQLREDPDLNNVFADMDFQMEFDALGEDLNIPETTPLEQELWW